MILEKNSSTTTVSTVQGEKIKAKIHDDAGQHLMDVLTNLYNDPEYAVIREYSTNARDAHIECGIDRPIEVTLPSELSPFFMVRDFGYGLSREDIIDVFTQYGASTKRDSDEYNGALGLGCKSGLTYTNSFNIVSRKDGIEMIMAFQYDMNGMPEIVVVGEPMPTEEASGVQIIVPVKRHNAFARKAATFFSVWDEGTVFVNGNFPERVDGIWVDDDMLIQEHNGYGDHLIVMAGVPYPCPGLVPGLRKGRLIAFVNTGDVNFTPSREALRDTPRTRDTIRTINAYFKEIAPRIAQHQIDKCDTPHEALSVLIRLRGMLPKRAVGRDYTFKGMFLPEGHMDRTALMSGVDGKLSASTRSPVILPEAWPAALWVVGFDLVKFTPATKKKLLKYVKDEEITGVRHFIMTTKDPDRAWVDSDRIVKWETIQAIKLPRTHSGPMSDPNRIPGSYDIIVDGKVQYGVPDTKIDTSEPIFYVSGSDVSSDAYNEQRYAKQHFPGSTIVVMTSNRIAKFRRLFPDATTIRDAVMPEAKAWAESLSREDRIALVMPRGWNTNYDGITSARKINDPEIKLAVRAYKRDVSAIKAQRAIYQNIGCFVEIKTKWKDPFRKYPLFDNAKYKRYTEDMTLYLNAAYAARKDS